MEEQRPFRLRWPHYLLAALVYLALLLAWAPASLLAWALPRFTQQAVWLDQAEGSVWHGRAGVLLWAEAGADELGRVDWQLRPLDLLGGRLGYRLQFAGTGVDAAATLRAGVQGGELREVRAELPASLLAQFVPDLAPWQPGGSLALQAEHLAFGRDRVEGTAVLRWRDAVSGQVSQPLGSYRADLDGTEQGLAIKLSTEGGALVLQGSGLWRPQHGLDFRGLARPTPASRGALDGLLGLLGPAQADGSRAIRIGRPI
jgi:general secretion pathway protein N